MTQTGREMIRKGDQVFILPQWQDAGDCNYQWFATEDEAGGRVSICPRNLPMSVLPVYRVRVDMLRQL